jgi:hypothetical protein
MLMRAPEKAETQAQGGPQPKGYYEPRQKAITSRAKRLLRAAPKGY